MQLDLLWYYQAYNNGTQFVTTTLIKMEKKQQFRLTVLFSGA